MSETSFYFKTETEKRAKFNSKSALCQFSNKDIMNAFLDKFIENPKETLKYLELRCE